MTEHDAMCQEIERLRATNKRLREALELVSTVPFSSSGAAVARNHARRTLAATEETT